MGVFGGDGERADDFWLSFWGGEARLVTGVPKSASSKTLNAQSYKAPADKLARFTPVAFNAPPITPTPK
jgi:hypothetical protein